MKLNEFAVQTLRDRYMIPTDVTPEDVFYRSVDTHCSGEHLERMRMYIDKQWFVPSTPALANGGTSRGSEIACFLPNIDDSRESLNEHFVEVNWLSSNGGGVGGNWSGIRSNGAKTSKGSSSNGAIPFMGILDRSVLAFAQGGTRRASYAAYMAASHPEVQEFIDMRRPTGGDLNRKNLNLHHGVSLSDEFMRAVKENQPWKLIDPHNQEVRKVVQARHIWEQILETRAFQGEPYMFFSDNANRERPAILEELGVQVEQSNLCTEILSATRMPDGSVSTGVCCLGSLNVSKYNEFRDILNQVVRDCLWYLWLVLDNFINTPMRGAERAQANARYYRDVGLGTVGWHSYLQNMMIPFDCAMAKSLNNKMYHSIWSAACEANLSLRSDLPACPAAIDVGRDEVFTHMLAIAPNASTALFVDTSGGVEPYIANATIRKTATGTSLWRNKYLERELEKLGLNTESTWHSIQINNGSVQHLDIPDEIKQVFKTAYELNQLWIIEHAADRQKYLDHTQSVNLFLVPNTPREFFSKLHMLAWEKGLPTLYYCRALAGHKASVGVDVQTVQQDQTESDCIACAN